MASAGPLHRRARPRDEYTTAARGSIQTHSPNGGCFAVPEITVIIAAVLAVATETVIDWSVVPVTFREFGVTMQVALGGPPEHENETAPLKPEIGDNRSLYMAV